MKKLTFLLYIFLGIVLGIVLTGLYIDYNHKYQFNDIQPSHVSDITLYDSYNPNLRLSVVYENLSQNTGFFISTVKPTQSMLPTISDKSYVLYVNVSEESELSVGDIVYIIDGDKRIIHRIIKITDKGYVTKGDNNFFRDWEVRKIEQIKGKVIGVLY